MNCDFKLNGLPVFVVNFSDFNYLLSLFKNNKRFLTRELEDQRIIDYVKQNKRKSNDFYFKYGDVVIDFRTYKQVI